jgi:hypothetical protein
MSASGDSDGLTTSPPLARMLEGLPVTERRLEALLRCAKPGHGEPVFP